jgi:hypothetical protein
MEVGEKYMGKHSPDEYFRGRWNGRERQKVYRTRLEEDRTLFLFIHRNVFAWLASVRLYPFGAFHLRNKPMSEFIRTGFTSTTERVRDATVPWLEYLHRHYELPIKPKKLEYIGDIQEARRQYYLEHLYMNEFTQEDIEFVLSQSDLEVEKHFGYNYEDLLLRT